MASRKQSRRQQKKSPNPLQQTVSVLSRPEVIGASLMVLAVFTLLSLVTGSRGALTGAWIDLLSAAFGVGAWGFPLVSGALGLWMVIHAIERMPDLPWQRPAGFLLLFLAYITGATLLMQPVQPDAGGWLGRQVAEVLLESVGRYAAWSFVTLLAVGGVVLLIDTWLVETAVEFWERWLDWRDRRRARTVMPPIQPAFPLPSGQVPWWKRIVDRRLSKRPQPVLEIHDNLVTATPGGRQAAQPPARQSSGQSAARAQTPDTSRPGTPGLAEGDILTPRIVGGAQDWRLPRLADILSDWERSADSDDHIRMQGRLIQETLALFGVPADFEGAYKGPAVTQYLIKPGYVERKIQGEAKRVKVKVSKIAALANDLALALAASTVRIEAPIPGTNYVGVEVPNKESNTVGLKELMESDVFEGHKGKLRIALGEDVKGQTIVTDLTRMPHLLIAGATGSGKSICINSIIACLLCTHTPDSLRMLMIDPKMVELSVFNGIPHLLSPVVTEIDKAAGVLFWAVKEMERRYQLFNKAGARDLERYNSYLQNRNEKRLPYIVVVVDEMADLMMAAPEEVEKHVCRLAQMARAVGIHLIIATQRPSVDVITGLIKANFPARIAFAVTSQTDSRVILDVPGAERLLGRGDMLFMAPDASKLERLQGAFTGDDEISRIVRYWKGIRSYDDGQGKGFSTDPDDPSPAAPGEAESVGQRQGSELTGQARPLPSEPVRQAPLFDEIETLKAIDERDGLFDEAVRVVQEARRGSVSLLQRKLRIGYSRASRLVDQLEEAGLLSPDQGGSLGREYLGDGPPDNRSPSLPPPHIIGDDEGETPPRIWM